MVSNPRHAHYFLMKYFLKVYFNFNYVYVLFIVPMEDRRNCWAWVPRSWSGAHELGLDGDHLESNKHLTTEPPGIFFLNIEFFLKPIL